MNNIKYDNYEIIKKGSNSSFTVSAHFIMKSDVLTNLIIDSVEDSNIIKFPENFDIESLKKSYNFYQEIKDLTIKDSHNNDIPFVDYIEHNLDDIKNRYSSKNIDIPHFEVFKKYSESQDFMSNFKNIIKLNDFLNLESITRMMAPIISIFMINLPYDMKVEVFKEMRIKLGHLNDVSDETKQEETKQ